MNLADSTQALLEALHYVCHYELSFEMKIFTRNANCNQMKMFPNYLHLKNPES